MSTAAGREALAIYHRILDQMTPQQRSIRAMEMIEGAEQTFRAGLKDQFPEADDQRIDEMVRDHKLARLGLTIEKIRQLQAAENS